DGIRDFHVTGVQTCALPIFGAYLSQPFRGRLQRLLPGNGFELSRSARANPPQRLRQACGGIVLLNARRALPADHALIYGMVAVRSEERRVGKEGRSRRWRAH